MRRFFFIITPFIISLVSACQRNKPNPAYREYADSAKLVQEVFNYKPGFFVYDVGGVFSSDTNYYEFHPTNTAAVSVVTKHCYSLSKKIRVRGKGHSMNGSSLPKNGELYLVTDKLNKCWRVNDSIVEVEAGVSMQSIRNWLRHYGRDLPVINDGGAGPSLGGYISAGGIGEGSWLYGGFWENVEEVTLVDGTGTVKIIKKEDAAFKWLFGSAGQLGIITKAKLKTIRFSKVPLRELPDRSTITEEWAVLSEGQHTSHEFIYKGEKIVFWLNIYAPWTDKDEAMEFSHSIRVQNQQRTVLQPDCIWKISCFKFVPPLIYPKSEDLICIGVWGYIPVNKGKEEARQYLIDMENGFMKQIMADRKYRRYIQTEIVSKEIDYRSYLGAEIYDEFKKLKFAFDPKLILNNGFFKHK